MSAHMEANLWSCLVPHHCFIAIEVIAWTVLIRAIECIPVVVASPSVTVMPDFFVVRA